MSRLLQFWCKFIHAELLKPVRFVFCVIIIVIPSMLRFPSFQTISYHFPWCFRMFLLVFVQFLQVFLLFPLSVSPVSFLDFVICMYCIQVYVHISMCIVHIFTIYIGVFHLVCTLNFPKNIP